VRVAALTSGNEPHAWTAHSRLIDTRIMSEMTKFTPVAEVIRYQ